MQEPKRDDLQFLIPANVKEGFEVFGAGIRELIPCVVMILLAVSILVNAPGIFKLVAIFVAGLGVFLILPSGGEPALNPLMRMLKRVFGQKAFKYGRVKE